MKRFMVAVATTIYLAGQGAKFQTRFYCVFASKSSTAAKRVMQNVTAADSAWQENNNAFKSSTLIFAETLTKRKIKALDAAYTVSLAERMNMRYEYAKGNISWAEYKEYDNWHDRFIDMLDAIEH